MDLRERLRAQAGQRHAAGLDRTRRMHGARHGAAADCDGAALVNFCGNDYLGFAQHPAVIAAFRAAAAEYGVGSAGSALVSGYFSAHRALEEQAAALFGYEAALYAGSGYLANLAVLTALLDGGALCVQDKRNHACLIDGARFSGAVLKRYPHADLTGAERALADPAQALRMLVSDGVFSMDGDAADIAGLAQIAARHDATLMIDDAHGVGVLGATGLGSMQAAGLNADDVPILVIPAGKAVGGQGALVLSNREVIAHLVATARPYLFSTAPAPAMAAALSQSLRLLETEPAHHAALQANIRQFTALAAQAGLPLLPSHTAIQPLLAGDNERAVRWSEALRAQGFWIGAIRPPTVAAGSARLRITLTALHTPAQIEALVEALQAVIKDDDDAAH